MVFRHSLLSLRLIVWSSVALSLFAGCASMGNTLAQDLAWERWEKCKHIPTVNLKEIRPDGQVWVIYTNGGAHVTAWQECMRKAAEEQAARRVAVAPPAQIASTPTQIAKEHPSAASAPPLAPIWKVGDEWAYRWESPRGQGTFVWSVDREEIVDGVPFYVVTAGQREIFYRKADLALYLDKLEGAVETRHVPPSHAEWPLVPGKTFEQRYQRERPKERQTEEMWLVCEVGPEENLTVPAGTFRSFKIACRNQRTGSMSYEIWYSPEVKHMVRERTHFSYGVRERELIAFKLR